MRKSLRWALAIGIPMALLSIGCGGGEPSFKGRTVAEWMEDFKNPEYDVNRRAISAIVGIGEPAVSSLTAGLKDEDRRIRVMALLALRELGPKGKAAIPALCALFDGSESALGTDRQFFLKTVAGTLGRMGPDGIRALLEATKISADDMDPLSTKDPAAAFRGAAKVFFLFEAFDASAIPILIEIMNDKGADAGLRSQAMLGLGMGMAGKGSEEAAAALVQILKGADETFRFLAAHTLTIIAPENEDLYGYLIEWLKDKESDIRWNAASMLGRLGGRAVGALPLLEEALKDEDDDVRRAAAEALKAIRLETEEGIPELVKRLKGADDHARYLASESLVRVGPSAVPALIEVLVKGPSVEARKSAAETLEKLGPGAEPAIPALLQALKDPDDAIVLAASSALGAAGPKAVPGLTEALKHEDPRVREAAKSARRSLTSEDP